MRNSQGTTAALLPKHTVTVVSPARAVLSATLAGPATLTAANQAYTLQIANSGTESLDSGLTADLSIPANVTVTNSASAGWLCQLSASDDLCTLSQTVGPRAQAPPLTLDLGGVATANGTQASLTDTLMGTDDVGPVSGSTATVVSLPKEGEPILSLASTQTSISPTTPSFTLAVTNSGDTATGLTSQTVTEDLPSGVTVSGAGTGWTCGQSLSTLSCVSRAHHPFGRSDLHPHHGERHLGIGLRRRGLHPHLRLRVNG